MAKSKAAKNGEAKVATASASSGRSLLVVGVVVLVAAVGAGFFFADSQSDDASHPSEEVIQAISSQVSGMTCDGVTRLIVPVSMASDAAELGQLLYREAAIRGANVLAERRSPELRSLIQRMTQDLGIDSGYDRALGMKLQHVGIRDDGYCDCDDGTDEPTTGVCDRAFGRKHFVPPTSGSDAAAKSAGRFPDLTAVVNSCPVQSGAHLMPLKGSQLGDGIADCCDCADEPKLRGAACPRDCRKEATQSVKALEMLLRGFSEGAATCRKRAEYGRTRFQPAYNKTLAERRQAINEVIGVVNQQIQRRERLSGGAGRPIPKEAYEQGDLIPDEQLQAMLGWAQTEQPKQSALDNSLNSLGDSFQFYPFAPATQMYPEIAAKRGSSLSAEEQQAIADHKMLCLNTTRHETSFRGGTAIADSYNFTFVVCPFDSMHMYRQPVTPRNDSDAAKAEALEKSPKEDEQPSVLARFIGGGVSFDLSGFNSFFAMYLGGAGPYQLYREDSRVPRAMQALLGRPEIEEEPTDAKGKRRRKKRNKPKSETEPALQQSPLHQFDYEAAVSASVQPGVWMSHGDDCWGGPGRHARVAFLCGASDKLLDVFENGKCAYEAVIQTPSACCAGPTPDDEEPHFAEVKARTAARLEELRAFLATPSN